MKTRATFWKNKNSCTLSENVEEKKASYFLTARQMISVSFFSVYFVCPKQAQHLTCVPAVRNTNYKTKLFPKLSLLALKGTITGDSPISSPSAGV